MDYIRDVLSSCTMKGDVLHCILTNGYLVSKYSSKKNDFKIGLKQILDYINIINNLVNRDSSLTDDNRINSIKRFMKEFEENGVIVIKSDSCIDSDYIYNFVDNVSEKFFEIMHMSLNE